MEEKVLTPVKQALVPFYGIMILAVLLPDGRIAATLRSLCNMLKLARHGQMARIRNDAALAQELLLVTIETAGGPQVTEVLTAKAIPTWLSSPRKMTHRAFERLHQVADTLQQVGDALHGAVDELDEIYMVAQEEREAMGDHIVALEAEVASLKQEPARNTRRQTTVNPVPSDGPRLSKDHLYQMYALAHDERRRSGQRVDRLLRELAQTFGVEDMSDISDTRWEEVAAWFWERRQPR